MNNTDITPGQDMLQGINQIYIEGKGFEPVFLGKRHKHLVAEMIDKSFNNLDDGSPHFILSHLDKDNALYLSLTDTGSVYFINKVIPSLPVKDALDKDKKYIGVNTIGVDRSVMFNQRSVSPHPLQLETIISSNKFESPDIVDDESVVGSRNPIDSKYDPKTRLNAPSSDTHDYIMSHLDLNR